jgi:hypothetical protein
MREKSFSAELARVVGRYKGVGGVIDLALFELEPGEACTEAHQRQAAILANNKFHYEMYPHAGCDPTIAPEKMAARAIDVSTFLGPWCQPDRKTLAAPSRADSDDSWHGFAYAFSHPPYALRLPPEELQGLYERSLDLLFGPLSEAHILEWTTEWAFYFANGYEWWGAFAWTVWSPRWQHVAVVFAASTD